MGKLLDLLKASAGERNLRNALGRWRQAVSASLDALPAPGTTYPHIITRRDSTSQVVTAPGTDLLLNAVAANAGFIYNTTTGLYSLEADSVYELEFFGQFESFADPAASVVAEWVNFANAPLVGAIAAQYLAVNSTLGVSNKPVAKVIYTTTLAESVKLRATQTPSGGANMSVDSYAVVRQIG